MKKWYVRVQFDTVKSTLIRVDNCDWFSEILKSEKVARFLMVRPVDYFDFGKPHEHSPLTIKVEETDFEEGKLSFEDFELLIKRKLGRPDAWKINFKELNLVNHSRQFPIIKIIKK